MSTFLKLLPLELKEIDNYSEPKMELEKGDHNVGVMSTDLKKLYTLWMQYSQRIEELKISYRFGKAESMKEVQAKISEISSKADALKAVFWVAVYDEFNLWDKSSVGVRRGYKVVWSESHEPNMPPFLRELLDLS